MQCGFCTPGMAMAAAALLERNADPTPEDVERAIGAIFAAAGLSACRRATLAAPKRERADHGD